MMGGSEVESGSPHPAAAELTEAPGLADLVAADVPAPVPLDPKFRAIAAALIALRDADPVPPPMPPKRHWQR